MAEMLMDDPEPITGKQMMEMYTDKTEARLIYKKMIAVMREIGAIEKDRTATMGNKGSYAYRGYDDVLNALHTLMSMHGIFTLPTVLDERTEIKKSSSGGELFYRILKIRYDFMAEDGSYVSCVVVGEGMDSGDKATNKATTVAHRIALTQTFLIPTKDAKDPEIDHHEVRSQQKEDNWIYQGLPDQVAYLKSVFDYFQMPEDTRLTMEPHLHGISRNRLGHEVQAALKKMGVK